MSEEKLRKMAEEKELRAEAERLIRKYCGVSEKGPLTLEEERAIGTVAFALARDREAREGKKKEERNEEVDEFNAGYAAFENGISIDDEPCGTKYDVWKIGWVWAAHHDKKPDDLSALLVELAEKEQNRKIILWTWKFGHLQSAGTNAGSEAEYLIERGWYRSPIEAARAAREEED